MNYILRDLASSEKFKKYINEKTYPIKISGLAFVAKAQLIAATYEEKRKPICLITYNEIQAKKIYEDMGYQIYLMDKTINNEEFSNNVTQFDLLVSESDSSEDILTIEEVVLANYEELIGTGM